MRPIALPKARKIFVFELAVILVLVSAIVPFSKLAVDLHSFGAILYIAGFLILVSLYCHFRGMNSFGAATEIIGLGFLLTIAVLILTYLAIAADLPLADEHLSDMDRALGFDWLEFIRFVDARPYLAYWLGEAYQTISFQLLLIPIALIATGKPQRAYAMMSGYGIICVLASFIAAFYPALGTYAYYGMGYDDVANIYPYFALAPIEAFEAVREQAVYTLTLGSASGLVCFPSVHAGVAYLSTWAVWGNKWLRYPVLLLNIAMAISAISHANHYLVDIIAGFGVAAFATSIVTALFYEHSGWKFRIARRSNPWELDQAAKDVVLTTPRGE